MDSELDWAAGLYRRCGPLRPDRGKPRLPPATDAWERYLHAAEPDKLVGLVILQAEFEALHPCLAVSRDAGWTSLCRFFLEAVRQQAEEKLAWAQAIIGYGAQRARVVERTRFPYGILALDRAFEWPVFRSTDFVARTGIPSFAARRILGGVAGSRRLQAPPTSARAPVGGPDVSGTARHCPVSGRSLP